MLLVLLLTTLCGLGVRGQYSAHCGPGRTVIVHLFEWKFADIAAECERYLGPKGFCGVQVGYFYLTYRPCRAELHDYN